MDPKQVDRERFIILADVDLLPIGRHRFDHERNETNHILIVNADCCTSSRFSYGNYQRIDYYPISYVGMTQTLWKDLLLPLDYCSLPEKENFTVDFIRCALKEIFNETIPIDVIKGTEQWDIDQKFLR